MDESERDILLNKIDRDSLTVGSFIPETMEVREESVDLNELVFEVCSDGRIPDQYNLDLNDFKVVLRREMNDCTDEIEKGEITYQRGLELVEKVGQIQRALNVLEDPEEDTDLEKKSKLSSAEDTKRWREFVSKIQEV